MYKDLTMILRAIAGLLPEGCEAYLVGGTVRDMLMGRTTSDADIVVNCDPGALAHVLGRKLSGSAFTMDEVRRVHRVAFRSGAVLQADISPLKGNIRDDLAGRDFTVNAMAAPLTGAGVPGVISTPAVIDPFGGRGDIESGVIRVVSNDAFNDDPLRILRAFRFSAQLGFAIEGDTLRLVRANSKLVKGVSPECLRDEVYMMLECAGVEATLESLHDNGVLFELFPEMADMRDVRQGEPHVYSLLKHSIRAAGHAEAVMGDTAIFFGENAGAVDEYLGAKADGIASMRGIVKLCALLHDTGKPSTMKSDMGRTRFFGHAESGARINEEAAARLRMSDRVRRTLGVTAGMHMRPLGLSAEGPGRRALYRLVRDAGDLLPALLLVALADARATREMPDSTVSDVEGLVRSASDYYYGEYRAAAADPLIRGGDVLGEFGIEPGPAVGRILRDVEEMRADGRLKDRAEALGYVKENLDKYVG